MNVNQSAPHAQLAVTDRSHQIDASRVGRHHPNEFDNVLALLTNRPTSTSQGIGSEASAVGHQPAKK
jgi:hypothetical protein